MIRGMFFCLGRIFGRTLVIHVQLRTYCVEAAIARKYSEFNTPLPTILTRCIMTGIHLED